MELIKKARKNYKKRNQNPKKKSQPLRARLIHEGSIVEATTLAHTQYIVISRNYNEIIVLDRDLLKNKIYTTKVLNVNRVNYVSDLEKDDFLELLLEYSELSIKETNSKTKKLKP